MEETREVDTHIQRDGDLKMPRPIETNQSFQLSGTVDANFPRNTTIKAFKKNNC